MALILIFSLSLQAPFPPLGDPSRVAGVVRGGGGGKKGRFSTTRKEGREATECHQKTQGHVQRSAPREGGAAWQG